MTEKARLEQQQTPPSLRMRDFFLGRQPILDREQSLYAYELLFRNAESGPANITSDLSATASVIAYVAHLGMEKVIGSAFCFVNVDAAVLESDIFQFLPREKVVLEIVETMDVTPHILERIAELRNAGYRFALDDVIAETETTRQLLPFVEFIKLDVRDIAPANLLKLVPLFKSANKKVVAEKVETREEFDLCLALGCDYFQGFYFARPVVLRGKSLSPSQLAMVQLMGLLNSDADDAVIEQAIKRDVSLGLNLLRMVNTPAASIGRRVDSLRQALVALGRRQLQRWLQIMLYAEPAQQGCSMTPLLMLAAGRGKLLELLAEKLQAGDRQCADTAFTVGIMSLMDVLFSMPMTDILEQIAVGEEVAAALLSRSGFYGNILALAEHLDDVEQAETHLLADLRHLRLSSDELVAIELQAFAWGDEVALSAV